MAISEAQLTTWANQGPIASSSNTYNSIKLALGATDSPIRARIASGEVKIYLQGSYANHTNTRGDSDVDIVAELTTTFHSNKLALPASQLAAHEAAYAPAEYQWHQFRNDVAAALERYYSASYVDRTGNKSLKVLPNSGRLRADVVPVTTYNAYSYFHSQWDHGKVQGVHFYHMGTNREIVNFPAQHYDNGVAKHQATSEQFKGIVRILKNARSCAVDRGILRQGVAPSYFLQGMIYNVPNELFRGTWAEATRAVLVYLLHANREAFVCQNGLQGLFGSTPEQWNTADAAATIDALVNLWDSGA